MEKMDKGIRTILAALVILSLVSIVTAVRFFVAERQTFEKFLEVKRTLSQEKARLERELSASEAEMSRLKSQLDTLNQLRTQLEEEREVLLKESDNMVPRLVELEEKIEDLESEPFLANLLKGKARLEVEAKSLKERLKSKEAQLEKVTKTKEKLASELEKRKIEARVVELLSRDLAEAKRDKLIAILTLEQVEAKNRNLKERLAQLSEIETSLEEKLIVTKGKLLRASEERDRLQRRLGQFSETKSLFEENLLVARDQLQRVGKERDRLAGELVTIRLALKEREEEIDRVKTKLAKAKEETRKFKELIELSKVKLGSIELPPIVVKADTSPRGEASPRTPHGRIVTVNDKYEFVVIDLGSEDDLETGMLFTVYRDDKEIGEVEIIEVHQRVSAANIKTEGNRVGVKVDDIVVPTR